MSQSVTKNITKKLRPFQAVIFFTYDLEYCYNLITDQRLCDGSDSLVGGFVKEKGRLRVSISHGMTCFFVENWNKLEHNQYVHCHSWVNSSLSISPNTADLIMFVISRTRLVYVAILLWFIKSLLSLLYVLKDQIEQLIML